MSLSWGAGVRAAGPQRGGGTRLRPQPRRTGPRHPRELRPALLAPLLRTGGGRQQRQVVRAEAAPAEWGPAQAVGVLQGRGQPAAPALGQQQDAQQRQDGEGREDHVVQEEATPAVQVGQGGGRLAQEAGPQHEAQAGPPAGEGLLLGGTGGTGETGGGGGTAWGLRENQTQKFLWKKVLFPILEQVLFFSLGK